MYCAFTPLRTDLPYRQNNWVFTHVQYTRFIEIEFSPSLGRTSFLAPKMVHHYSTRGKLKLTRPENWYKCANSTQREEKWCIKEEGEIQ
jgi:hypothetical protein